MRVTLLLGTGFLHINGVLETCYITKSYQFSPWMKYNIDDYYFFYYCIIPTHTKGYNYICTLDSVLKK